MGRRNLILAVAVGLAVVLLLPGCEALTPDTGATGSTTGISAAVRRACPDWPDEALEYLLSIESANYQAGFTKREAITAALQTCATVEIEATPDECAVCLVAIVEATYP
ncbi:MAG: hypothetical protein JXB13_01930 [Phycisphaerae bacterium]|nr:hypothetical protein [Phycisphaerae bacterium]